MTAAEQQPHLELVEGGDPRAPEPVDIMDPVTGEVISIGDVDGLLAAFDRVDQQYKDLGAFRRLCAEKIAAHTTGTAKTRRLRGKRYRAKVEMPGPSWSSSLLKAAWEAHPGLREEVLKIDAIGVKAREWAKWKAESGPEDFEALKAMIAAAEREPSGTPRITVEEVPHD